MDERRDKTNRLVKNVEKSNMEMVKNLKKNRSIQKEEEQMGEGLARKKGWI
jgi:hypothetical protein